MSAAAIIFSISNESRTSRLTLKRTVAAIPFSCRYRLIDPVLSNMINANISNIEIVVNYNYKSLLDHVGSGKDWDLARRKGGISFVSPYGTVSRAGAGIPLYTNRMEALKSMEDMINSIREDVVVLADCDCVCNIDIADVIACHESSESEITAVAGTLPAGKTLKYPRLFFSTNADGRITDVVMSESAQPSAPLFGLGIYVMNTAYLRKLVSCAKAHDYRSFSHDVMIAGCKYRNYFVYEFKEYFAPICGFSDYYESSMELLSDRGVEEALFGRMDRPVLTRVHNSAPVVYKEGAEVTDSLVGDDCVIEGKVENSIIFRGVKIGKNSVVRNSILFSGTYVGSGVTLDCVVADKDVSVGDDVTLRGRSNIPFYIERAKKI